MQTKLTRNWNSGECAHVYPMTENRVVASCYALPIHVLAKSCLFHRLPYLVSAVAFASWDYGSRYGLHYLPTGILCTTWPPIPPHERRTCPKAIVALCNMRVTGVFIGSNGNCWIGRASNVSYLGYSCIKNCLQAAAIYGRAILSKPVFESWSQHNFHVLIGVLYWFEFIHCM